MWQLLQGETRQGTINESDCGERKFRASCGICVPFTKSMRTYGMYAFQIQAAVLKMRLVFTAIDYLHEPCLEFYGALVCLQQV